MTEREGGIEGISMSNREHWIVSMSTWVSPVTVGDDRMFVNEKLASAIANSEVPKDKNALGRHEDESW